MLAMRAPILTNIPQPLPAQLAAPEKAQALSFADVLAEKLSGLESMVGLRSYADLAALRRKVLTAKSVSPGDLILYQVKASEFGLGVELVSKVAESMATTVRKFQSNQG